MIFKILRTQNLKEEYVTINEREKRYNRAKQKDDRLKKMRGTRVRWSVRRERKITRMRTALINKVGWLF